MTNALNATARGGRDEPGKGLVELVVQLGGELSMSNFADLWKPSERETIYRPPAPTASNAVLEALRPRRGYETAKWLSELKQEVATKAPAVSAEDQSRSLQNMMNAWIDTMFEHFEQFALDFNQSAMGTDLIVTVTKPTFNYRTARNETYHTESKITTFEGHLSTRFWALVVQGRYERIEVNIVPTDILLGFLSGSFTREEYPPFMEIEASWCNGQMCWQLDGQQVSSEILDTLTGELFGDLIRVASGTMTEEELFSQAKSGKHELGLTVAKGVNPSNPAVRTFDLHSLQLWNALEEVRTAIGHDLNTLSEEEMAAMQSDNAAIDTLRQFSERLSAFRQKVAPLVADLKNFAEGKG